MKITLNNYEAYALDYLEGNLPVNQHMAFESFLDTHPGIRDELIGVNHVVLKPDTPSIYPDKSRLYRKERGTIISLWGISRLVAAAIALLLVSTATFFLWKSTTHPGNRDTSHPTTDYSNTESNERNLPATRIPMPENDPSSINSDRNTDVEQPETNVMAQNGNVSDRPENIRPASPALTSGNANTPSPIPEEVLPEIRESMEPGPETMPISYDSKTELARTKLNNSLALETQKDDAVSFLPAKIPVAIRSKKIVHDIAVNKMEPVQSPGLSEDTSIKIHIPGEFLSDTWTDVSVASFKKKLIPQFIKNQLNL